MAVLAHQLDSSPGNGARTALEDEAETDIEASDINGNAATTMHGRQASDGYNPSAPCPCERFATKRQKYERLWRVNVGLDTHRTNGEDVDHSKLGKVNENAREKRRIVETLASRLELPRHLTERASDLAAKVDARGFALWGGRQAVAVAAVQAVAPFDVFLGVAVGSRADCQGGPPSAENDGTPSTSDTVDRDGENIEIRREITQRLGASDVGEAVARLEKATEKIEGAA